jgi:hypothetical protein
MVGRGWEGSAYASHYVYIGAVLLVLVGAELFAGLRAPARVARTVTAIACIAATANTAVLVHFSAKRRHDADVVRAQVGALELARAAVPADFKINDNDDQAPSLYAGPYFRGIRALGSSPAPGPGGIAATGEDARAAADGLLVRAFGLAPRPARPPLTRLLEAAGLLDRSARLERSSNALVHTRGGCVSMRPAHGALAAMDFRVAGAKAAEVTASRHEAQVRVRRFATAFPSAPAGGVGGRAYVLTPRDAAPQSWRLRVSSDGPVRVC